jgi:hypothetical protein
MQGPIEHVRVTISMKGCEINPCDSYIDNPLVAENVLYAGAYAPKPVPGHSGAEQNFVGPPSSLRYQPLIHPSYRLSPPPDTEMDPLRFLS